MQISSLNLRFLTALTLATVLGIGQLATAEGEAKKTPSSEIPQRREFPVNTAVNPCEDFHKYVCSEVESSFKLRDDRSYHDFAFSDSEERLLETKKSFMKNLPNEKNLSPRAQQFKDFYIGCMDTPMRAKEEREKVAKLVKEIKKISSTKELIKYMNAQFLNGGFSLVNLFDSPNNDNPHKLDITFMSRLMDLPDHSYYEKAELVADYKKLYKKLLMTVLSDITFEQADARAEKMIQMQKEVIKTYPVAAVRRQRFAEKRTDTKENVIAKYPELQLSTILSKTAKSTLVNIPIPESLEFLNAFAKNENLQTLKDYYLYKYAKDLMDEAYSEFFNARFEFNRKYLGGPDKRPDLQERCTSDTAELFGLEIDQLLIDRLFPHFQDKKVLEVATQIRSSIIAGIESNSWLSAEAKKEALAKITTARLQLIRPQNDREWDFIPTQKFSTKLFIGNQEIRQRAQLQKTYDDLHHDTNQDAWGMPPLTVNAYYSPNENKFVLPIGILQYPFFDEKGDLISNLGAVGAVMGHELGHSIDDQGSKYDAKGQLRQWMSIKDLKEFSDRGQKMIAQFDKIGHNGKLTQGENVADLVGLSFAYKAAFPNGQGTDEDKKKFFTSYARVWCSVIRPDFATRLLNSDPHSAGWARINEQVKHQAGFAEAFQCKKSDKMNLPEEERIKIW